MRHAGVAENQRSWKTTLTAAGLLGVALLEYQQHPNLKGALAGGAFLLLAWRVAFVGAPRLNVTLGQIYRQNREGQFNWPFAGKIAELVAGTLVVVSFFV
ncbi:hypothetical protein [Luteibacter sahnii]|uniref:hypothetical protein n=1 Tax=Luteibacter sahnii TaxID=3021977 RepID=UPI002A6A2AEA|nr:hypothetical protein [Luteibacter sp. PPL193]MDY1549562.1 hypothetical protein [Luteibacter sp. PPL193]